MMPVPASAAGPNHDDVRRLISSISHDFRAPVRHISGFVDELAIELGDGLTEAAAENLSRVQAATEVLNQRLEALVAFGHITDSGQDRVSCDLTPVVMAAVEALDTVLRERGATVDPGPLLSVTADPVQLTYVIGELLANAVKFGGEGVSISVSVEESNGYRVIVVEDDGLGVRAGNVDVFALFRRCHGSAHPGFGVGLAAVQQIAVSHAGFVDFCSSPQNGATVRVGLPASTGGATGSGGRS